MCIETENMLRKTSQKAGYYLDMFARGKMLRNLGKKEQVEFKTFLEELKKQALDY